eukprot:3932028-Rhodomonas_salina.2
MPRQTFFPYTAFMSSSADKVSKANKANNATNAIENTPLVAPDPVVPSGAERFRQVSQIAQEATLDIAADIEAQPPVRRAPPCIISNIPFASLVWTRIP